MFLLGVKLSQTVFSIPKMKKSCGEVSQVLKALAHPQRLLILGHLILGPKSVNELVDLCEVSQPLVSQFLSRMRYEGLIASEKQGKQHIYSVSDPRIIEIMKTIQSQYCV